MKISKLDYEGLQMSFKMQAISAIENLVAYLRSIPENRAKEELYQMVNNGTVKLSMAVQIEECIKYPKAEIIIEE